MKQLSDEAKAFFRQHGITGGKKRMASMTPAQRRQFALKGVAARKSNGKPTRGK